MKKGLTLLIVVLAILLALVAYFRLRVQTENIFFSVFPIFAQVAVDQPVRFNHIHHKEVAHLNCAFCHRYVEGHRSAGIPNIELCQACHSTDTISKRPEALKVVEYVKAKKTIPWKRMYALPEYVVFPHWVHIEKGVNCSVCHGATGTTDRPVKMVDRNYMEWCIQCHKKKGASTDCYACHSS